MDICVVCHTEFGHVNNREIIYGRNVNGTKVGVPNLLSVANKYKAKVSFAVMPDVVKYFPRDSGHEIGLHIHPGWKEYDENGEHWCIGDSYLNEHCEQSINSVALRNYPYEEQLDMIRSGKDYLSDYFGVEPKMFVAGCWSVNNDTVRALLKAGFTHDCSLIPHRYPGIYDWSGVKRLCLPYRPDKNDYRVKGDLPILIVPTSQTIMGGYVSPELAPVLGINWLKACFREYYTQKAPLFNIVLHSPSMSDPYYLHAMDELLHYISKYDVKFKFISEIKNEFDIDPGANIFPYILGVNHDLLNTVAKKVFDNNYRKWMPHRYLATG